MVRWCVAPVPMASLLICFHWARASPGYALARTAPCAERAAFRARPPFARVWVHRKMGGAPAFGVKPGGPSLNPARCGAETHLLNAMPEPDRISPEAAPLHPVGAGHPGPAVGPRVLCPYCGLVQPVTARCSACKGLLDMESRQATQNAMGPWQVRNPASPFHPGCSFQTLRELVRRGKVTRETIIRGPTTAQFWSMAANTPGVAVLLGECHACHQPAREDEYLCRHCGVVLSPRADRQHLGLAPVRPVGVPLNALPVTSSPPQSAFSSAPADSASERAGVGVADPSAGQRLDTGPAEGAPVESLLARRRRHDHRRARALVIGAATLGVLALVAVIGVALSRGTASAPKSGGPPSGAAAPTGPRAAPPAGLDARARFAADLTEARRLALIGDAANIEAAVGVLERVKRDAAASGADAHADDAGFVAEIERVIEGLKVKLDDARLSEALAEPEKK